VANSFISVTGDCRYKTQDSRAVPSAESLCLHIGTRACTCVYVHAGMHTYSFVCTFARPWSAVNNVAHASPFKPPLPLPVPVSPVRTAIHSVLPTPASREHGVPHAPLLPLQQGNTGEGGHRFWAGCSPWHQGNAWLQQLQQVLGRKGLHFFP